MGCHRNIKGRYQTDLGVKQYFAKFGMSKVRPERQAGNGPMKILWEERH